MVTVVHVRLPIRHIHELIETIHKAASAKSWAIKLMDEVHSVVFI